MTGRVARGAMLAAMATALLYFSAVIGTGRLALIAAAGLVTAVSVVEDGPGSGSACFIGTALLGAILVPARGPVVLYALFFGY